MTDRCDVMLAYISFRQSHSNAVVREIASLAHLVHKGFEQRLLQCILLNYAMPMRAIIEGRLCCIFKEELHSAQSAEEHILARMNLLVFVGLCCDLYISTCSVFCRIANHFIDVSGAISIIVHHIEFYNPKCARPCFSILFVFVCLDTCYDQHFLLMYCALRIYIDSSVSAFLISGSLFCFYLFYVIHHRLG